MRCWGIPRPQGSTCSDRWCDRGRVDLRAGFAHAEGGVVAADGFFAAATHCGLKTDGKRDLALVSAVQPVAAAAVFTTNRVAAAPVVLSRRHAASGYVRAVMINAGNANACTGAQGEHDAQATARAVAASLACTADDVLVCSTGVIGVPLPVDRIVSALPELAQALDSRDGGPVAEAIMTTDTFPKQLAVSLEIGGRVVTVGGMAKGSGMIAPNMATMLAVVTTDAPLTPEACDAALRTACATTFNRVTVDSDTSTNDTLVLMASGLAGGAEVGPDSAEYSLVAQAVHVVCEQLARMVARDGEGATKLVTVTVSGAASERDAESAAFAVANSPLVKTALFGNDANWGRVAMAVGKSGAHIDPALLGIVFAGIEVCRDGGAVPFDEDDAYAALDTDEVAIEVRLGVGSSQATVLTCDLSYEYVRINGEYRS
jgi:glutamate N-acetyltransferase / amino-acid N-acetyltransferase